MSPAPGSGNCPTVWIDSLPASASESAGTVNIPVYLSPTSSQTVTVDYALTDNTAVNPDDYIWASGTLTFPAGVTVQYISVQIVDDALVEGTEILDISIMNPVNATISGSSTRALGIMDND